MNNKQGGNLMPMNEALVKAVINNQADEAQALIAQGANPNYCAESSENFTPLQLAALYNAAQVIPVLVQAGANIEALTAENGITALDIAEQHHHEAVAELLRGLRKQTPIK
ncbi:MAG: ankyrin repeat domain-containing protein [Coxiellaceae bacterium]|nr:ankyrin repeat domain-containing protein [Coxiellaceae bacterium]